MAAIDGLPDDLLAETLFLAARFSIGAKFAVGQVSARWRSVALNSGRLWAGIQLSPTSAPSSVRRLPLALARAGPSALLEILLMGPFSPEVTARLAEALVPCADRIRVLDLVGKTVEALLTEKISYPALDFLRIQRHWTDAELRLTAPNLRVLELVEMKPPRLSDVLSAATRKVTLHGCYNARYEALMQVLSLCPNLVHLAFTQELSRRSRALTEQPNIKPLKYLRTMSLELPLDAAMGALEAAIGHETVPRNLSVTLDSPRDAQSIQMLCSLLLRGTGPIVASSRPEPQYLLLQDAAGRERMLGTLMWNDSANPSFEHIWRFLAERHGAQDTVRDISIGTDCWNALAEDFVTHPPRVCESLRVLDRRLQPAYRSESESGSDSEGDEPSAALPDLRELVLPALRRVEFHHLGLSGRARFILLVLQRIACDTARTINVAVDPSTQDYEKIVSLLARVGGDRWRMVTRAYSPE